MKRLETIKSSFTATVVRPLLLAAGLSAAAVLGARAQALPGRGKARGTIQEAEIEIVKDRVNTLPGATRNFEKIRLAPPPRPDQKVTYTYPDFRLPATRLTPSVQVLTVAQEAPAPLTGNYLKLSLGNYGTVYGRAHLHATRNAAYAYGLDVRHQSAARGPVDGPNSAVSQSSVAATGEVYRGATALGAALDYGRERYHFYGYDRSQLAATPEKDAIRQTFHRFAGCAYARSQAPGAKVQYEVGVGVKYWKDDYTSSESNLLLDGKAGYALGEASRVTVQAEASFIKEKEDFTGIVAEAFSRRRAFVQVTPAYELTGKTGLSLTLGATLGYSSEPIANDQPNGVSKGAAYPSVRIGYAVVPEKFQVYGGLGGAIQRVTRYDLTQENPWLGLGASRTVADTHQGPSAYVGFTATPSSGLELAARATYSRAKNLYFYRNAVAGASFPVTNDTTKFDLVYEPTPSASSTCTPKRSTAPPSG